MAWTDERIDTLKRLWSEGSSASQIATALGDVTRNGVIGKLHRLGLSSQSRDVPKKAPKPKPERLPKAPKAERHAPPPKSILKRADPVPEPEPEPILPPGHRVTILMLTEQTCRWPIGTPGTEHFTFCGRRPGAGIPYCMAHARLAYQPAERRRAA